MSQEIWAPTTPGTVWVQVKDPRHVGGWRDQEVGGKAGRKLTLSVEEREFNQDLIPEDNAQHDPFTNGLLVRISPKVVERGQYELTDEQLQEMLAIDNELVFLGQVNEITSEVVVRRLLALAETSATLPRFHALQDLVGARYRVGKTSKVVKEIFEDDRKYADADL